MHDLSSVCYLGKLVQVELLEAVSIITLKGLVQAIGLFTYLCVGLPALIFYSWFNIQWLNIYELFLVDKLNVFSIIISSSCLDMNFDKFSHLIFIVAKNACSSKQRLEHVALISETEFCSMKQVLPWFWSFGK